jgi:sugar transferase (PEP-CTERM system associated)
MHGVFVPLPRLRQSLFLLVELGVLTAALAAAVALRFAGDVEPLFRDGPWLLRLLATPLLVQLCLYYAELYEDWAMRPRLDVLLRMVQAFSAATLLVALLYYVAPALKFGRGVLAVYLPLGLLGVLLLRLLHLWLAGQDALSRNVLILGTGVSAQQIAIELVGRTPLGYRVIGFLGEHPAEVGRRLVNPSVVGTMAELLDQVERQRVNLIVVALEDRRGKLPVKELLACRMNGIAVEEATTFYERLTGKILVNNLRPSWLVFSQGFRKPRLLLSSKAAAEFVVAALLIAAISPLLALLGLFIKLESRGPIFYRQERVGEKGRVFDLIKFRTMRVDAEAATGPVWAPAGPDPRVTRVGRWLRKARLDELPQLLNVLRGEMSFVGPRPERPHFVEQFRRIIPYYDERHSVRPGITGWAQVKFRYSSTIEDAEEKHQLDLYYVKHMSMLLDLTIVLDTIKVVLFGKGAR